MYYGHNKRAILCQKYSTLNLKIYDNFKWKYAVYFCFKSWIFIAKINIKNQVKPGRWFLTTLNLCLERNFCGGRVNPNRPENSNMPEENGTIKPSKDYCCTKFDYRSFLEVSGILYKFWPSKWFFQTTSFKAF